MYAPLRLTGRSQGFGGGFGGLGVTQVGANLSVGFFSHFEVESIAGLMDIAGAEISSNPRN